MQIRPGVESPLGYFPENLDPNSGGWSGQAYQIYSQALNIGKRYHDQNVALHIHAQAPNTPPPALPDVQARSQLARADGKRLAALKAKMAAIADEVKVKEASLRPFDYESAGIIDAMRRQEMRSHLRSMTDEQRREAMRTFQWRRAALESEPELASLSPVQYKALQDETLRAFFPAELEGINQGKQALEAITTAVNTVERAVDHELKSTTTTDQGPPPEESPPWI
jgi:hypothetical protein